MNSHEPLPDDLAVAEDLGRRAGLIFDNARLYQGQQHIAETLQRSLLPQLTGLARAELAARYLPGTTGAEVGGDFYDWYALSDSTQQFLLGDVMGKGVPAALIASSVRAVLRGASRFNPLGEAVTRTAYSLDWDLDETGTFVTLFCARLDPATAVVEYVDAGHGLAVVVDGYGGHRQLVSDGLPLGALGQLVVADDAVAPLRALLGRGLRAELLLDAHGPELSAARPAPAA